MASVGGIPAQSPEFESPDGLATFLWNNHVAKDHPHAAITLSSTGTEKLYASRSLRGQHEPLNKKRGVTIKI